MRLLHDIGGLSPGLEDGASAARVGAGLLARRDAVQAEGKLSSSATGSLGIGNKGIPVNIFEIILGRVVVGIGRLAISRETAGTGEETGRLNAEVEESDVVRRGSEFAGF